MLRQRGRARLLEEEVLSRLEHFDSQWAVVDRTGRQDDRIDLLACKELRVAARGDSEGAPQFLGAAFAGRRDRYKLDPWSAWAFSAWTVPIPPRPATPSRRGGRALDTARASMAASQSLAQSIFKPGVQRAAGVACDRARPPTQGHARRCRGAGRRLDVDRLSRSQRTRGLAPATRAAVKDAAAILNFQPSALARSLRTQQTFTVGFVVPDVSSPFYAAALKGAQGRLEQAGYRVMLMDANQDVERELAAVETLLSHQVDGLLVASAGMPRPLFESTVSRQTPAIFFDGVIEDAGDGAVTLDNELGIALLVEHLVEHGHERIGLLAGSQRESAGAARLQGFDEAMAAHGVLRQERYVKVCEWDIADGRRAALELLADRERATGVIASSAELALGFMSAAAAQRVRIPDDIALVAFDDPYFGDLLEPSLTAVAYDPRLIGSRAADLLVGAMRSGTEPREVRIPVELVRRRSCGCNGQGAA